MAKKTFQSKNSKVVSATQHFASILTSFEYTKTLNFCRELNKLVMNYLVIEGYKDAAEKFMKESGEAPSLDLASIEERMKIREAVQHGNISRAIELVNDLNPEILDMNPQLYFHLQQQTLIELIRENRIEEALNFAQEELAPRGEENVKKQKKKVLCIVLNIFNFNVQ
eukprot:Sdes_comp20502_c0_seq6m14983